jgi:hypothetical protein
MGCSLLGSFLILRWALTRNDTSLKAKARKQKKELAKRWGRNVELESEFENVRRACLFYSRGNGSR